VWEWYLCDLVAVSLRKLGLSNVPLMLILVES
jgi:hypothetical protein